MARMIPPTVHPATVSPGEHEIFRRLRDDPGTRDWSVLHSLDIAHHRTQISGEADFVVIVPHKGVLCIEVKACRHLRRENGQWYFGDSSEPDARGPFKQASEAIHSIRRQLVAKRHDLSHIPFWSAAMFPYLTFSLVSDEWHSWQVVDNVLFRTRPISTLIEHVLDRARDFLEHHPAAKWFDAKSDEPTAEQCQLIADLLRPDFEYFESPRSRTHRLQEQLRYYTSEQFAALDAMETNPRVAFCGPAGTGKTILAIEAARRGAEEGRRILLLCFNRLLGRWLEGQITDLHPSVVCKTLHSHMLSVAALPGVERSSSFWDTRLPLLATDQLLDNVNEANIFDELILDEAQDLMRDSYLDFLDLSLKGGLSSGRWRIFGDFEKQAIYKSANVSLDGFLNLRAGRVPAYSLRANCRNTPHVAELVHLLAGLSPGYSKVLRPDDRVEPELLYYSSANSQQQLLVATLARLYSSGYTGTEIVVLSPRADSLCAAATIEQLPWKDRLRAFDMAGRGQVGFCTTYAYKGLESPLVIVTDIDRIDDESQPLLYVAITRAVDRLILLLHENSKRDIRRLLGLENSLQS